LIQQPATKNQRSTTNNHNNQQATNQQPTSNNLVFAHDYVVLSPLFIAVGSMASDLAQIFRVFVPGKDEIGNVTWPNEKLVSCRSCGMTGRFREL